MIRCNLAVLMAERNLKITKVSEDTGISRTTLTSLVSNNSQGVQFDTINTLCMYLKVTPEQFISYVPIDIKINRIHREFAGVEVFLSITENGKTLNSSILGSIDDEWKDDRLMSLIISIYLYDADECASNEEKERREKENSFVSRILDRLPEPFVKDIEIKISKAILADVENVHENVEVEFYWEEDPWV